MRRNNAHICVKHIYSHRPLPKMLSVHTECIVTDRGVLGHAVCPTHLSITLRQCEPAIRLTKPQHVCFYAAGTWGAAGIGLYPIRNKRSVGLRFSACASWRAGQPTPFPAIPREESRVRSDRCHVLPCPAMPCICTLQPANPAQHS